MCTDYPRRKAYAEYLREFSQIRLPLVWPPPHQAPNLEPQESVRPTDPGVVFRRRDEGVELVRMRWWLVPWFHRGPLKEWRLPTFNARAEGLATSRAFRDAFARRRCLVAADGWIEWTGPKGRKTRWLVTPRGGEPICFAGLWDRAHTSDSGTVESYTIVTQPAGSPLNRYHDRAPVVLWQGDWARWLDLEADVQDLLGPESADRFEVSYVSGPPPGADGFPASVAADEG